MKTITRNSGIVIHTMDYKENASLVTLLTNTGKKTIIIKGAKKINSSTNRLAQVLTLIEYASTSTTLTEGIVIDNYNNIKDDIDKYNECLVIIEKLYYFIDQITDLETIWNFTYEILKKMKTTIYPQALRLIFEIKLLYLLGVAPNFNFCGKCAKLIDLREDNSYYFCVNIGGNVCSNCRSNYLTLDFQNTSLVRKIYLTKLKDVDEEFLKTFNDNNEIEKIINKYYQYHLEYFSKVKSILNKI